MMPGEWDWMNGTQDVSGIPTDDATAQLMLKRRLAQADLLKGAEMPQGQMVSGHYVAPSWTQYLANAVGKYQGGQQEQNAIKQYGDYQTSKNQKLGSLLEDLAKGKETKIYDNTPYQIQVPNPNATTSTNLGGMQPYQSAMKTIDVPNTTSTSTFNPYSQQEYMSKIGAVMPEMLPKMLETQFANRFKEDTPIISHAGDIGRDRNGKIIFQNPEKPEKMFGTVNPSDFTPASLAKYSQTGNYQDLLANPKEMTPYQQWEKNFRENEAKNKEANNFDSETIDMMADQALAGDKSVFSGRGMTGANIGAIRQRMNQKMRDKGWSGRDIAAANAEFMGNLAAERAIGTRGANVQLAGTGFENIVPIAQAASDKVTRSGFLPFGKVEIMFNEQTNSPELSAFAAANNGLVNTYARAISPTGIPNVEDKRHARKILSEAKDKAAYDAAVTTLQKEIQAEIQSPKHVRELQRQEISGRNQPTGIPSQNDIDAELARRKGH